MINNNRLQVCGLQIFMLISLVSCATGVSKSENEDVSKFEYLIESNDAKLLFQNNENELCTGEKPKHIPFGKFRVINNDWGYYKIKKGNYHQCISKYKTDKDSIFGWRWNMPKKAYGVIAYPEINLRIPSVPLGKIKRLKSTFDAKLYSERGRYNLAFDLWIQGINENGKKDIHTEIMIWEFTERSKPGGKYVEDVKTTNGTYQFYLGEVNNKRINKRWKYVAFVRKEYRTKGTTDIDELISYLLENKILTEELTAQTVELGTEIVNSKGYAIFKDYNVDFEYDKD